MKTTITCLLVVAALHTNAQPFAAISAGQSNKDPYASVKVGYTEEATGLLVNYCHYVNDRFVLMGGQLGYNHIFSDKWRATISAGAGRLNIKKKEDANRSKAVRHIVSASVEWMWGDLDRGGPYIEAFNSYKIFGLSAGFKFYIN